jgi:hypothetical protein
MNRLSPLIVRRYPAPVVHDPAPVVHAASYAYLDDDSGELPDWIDRLIEDVKMFAVAWVGGVVFFGTLLS